MWVTASAGGAVAAVGAPSFFAPVVTAVVGAKGGGRAMIAEPVVARVSSGAFAFSMARFAFEGSMIAAAKRDLSESAPALLSPIRDVTFHGFSAGAGRFAEDELRVVGVYHTPERVIARHDLWSHAPMRRGGTSGGVMFTAHDDVFGGFEITHMPANGVTSSGLFAFAASGSGSSLSPGVYVIAGPSAATGVAPDLGRYAYTGNPSAPVRENRVLGLDFTYLSFVVHGEWV